MPERITPRQFQQSDGVDDWRDVGVGACACFRTGSFGKGVALVRRSLIGDEVAAERLVAPLPQGLSKGMAYHLVYLPENMAQPAVRAFRAWLLDAVGRDGMAPVSLRSA